MIGIRYVGKPEYIPTYKTVNSVGADLYIQEETVVMPQFWARAPTGVFLDVERYTSNVFEVQVRPRSSLHAKFPTLLVEFGTVDMDYKDEVRVIVRNFGAEAITLPAGTSVAQIVLGRFGQLHGASYTQGVRSGGFGSTDGGSEK